MIEEYVINTTRLLAQQNDFFYPLILIISIVIFILYFKDHKFRTIITFLFIASYAFGFIFVLFSNVNITEKLGVTLLASAIISFIYFIIYKKRWLKRTFLVLVILIISDHLYVLYVINDLHKIEYLNTCSYEDYKRFNMDDISSTIKIEEDVFVNSDEQIEKQYRDIVYNMYFNQKIDSFLNNSTNVIYDEVIYDKKFTKSIDSSKPTVAYSKQKLDSIIKNSPVNIYLTLSVEFALDIVEDDGDFTWGRALLTQLSKYYTYRKVNLRRFKITKGEYKHLEENSFANTN